MGKYDPLRDYLRARGGEPLAISFDDLEAATGVTLPHAARFHRQWWANGTNAHTQASAWLAAGYKVAGLDLAAGTVRFVPETRGPDAATSEGFRRKERYQKKRAADKR